MMTMIEKVARAIAATWEDKFDWHLAIPEARAALSALREPTDAMCRTAAIVIADRRTWPTRTRTWAEEETDFFDGFRAAIDAALTEGKDHADG